MTQPLTPFFPSGKSHRNAAPPHVCAGAAPGLTLIEILAAIAVIGILASMLLMVVPRARHSAESIQCISNLRQLGVLTNMYMSDNQQLFPVMNNWVHQLLPYLESGNEGTINSGISYFNTIQPQHSIFLCAGANRATLVGNTARYRYGDGIISYGINATAAASSSESPRSPMILEASNPRLKLSRLMLYGEGNLLNLFWGADERCEDGRHGAGMNILFADFHVETVSDPITSTKFQNFYYGDNRF